MNKKLPEIVDLGCGEDKVDGAYGVDIVDTEQTDKIIDLESETWDLPENYFKEVYCRSILEHIENPVDFLENLHKISKDGALVHIVTPHFTSPHVYTDLTHKSGGLTSESIKRYFTSEGDYNFYTDARFEVKNIHIGFEKRKKLFWNYFIEKIANKWTWLYEHSGFSRIFPAANITHKLKVKKAQ